MDLILQSDHAPMLKLKLVAAWQAALTEIISFPNHREKFSDDLEALVAQAVLSSAAAGQTSPEELQRDAVSEVNSRLSNARVH